MTVWSLCDYTTVMLRPWAAAGANCWAWDQRHPDGITVNEYGVNCVGGNILDCDPVRYPYPDFVFAFPPCTHLASSGARWFAAKGLPPLIDALRLVQFCIDWCERARVGWAIENPVGRLSTCWRKPDHFFDPCDYGGYLDPIGDQYTKRTCLWVGGGFRMPEKKRVEPVEGSKMHLLPPSADRQFKRSETPAGFAQAVFEANYVTECAHAAA